MKKHMPLVLRVVFLISLSSFIFSDLYAASQIKGTSLGKFSLGCDYYLIEDPTGSYSLVEWFGGIIPDEGDTVYGELYSFGFKDLYTSYGSKARVWIDNYFLSEDRASEELIDKCGWDKNILSYFSSYSSGYPLSNNGSSSSCNALTVDGVKFYTKNTYDSASNTTTIVDYYDYQCVTPVDYILEKEVENAYKAKCQNYTYNNLLVYNIKLGNIDKNDWFNNIENNCTSVASNNTEDNSLGLQAGWLIKNKEFVEVFSVDENLCLSWIINEDAAERFYGPTWNNYGVIKEFDSIPDGYKFCENIT